MSNRKSIPIASGTDREGEIVRGVFWSAGEIYDQERREMVAEFHYHWLDADGTVLGHGDGYLSEEHVKAAMAGVLADFEADLPIEPGDPGKVDPRDAAEGRVSQTGSAHCLNCGQKLAAFEGSCPGCGVELVKEA